jgi:nuclear protein localization protein 4 homolog
VVLRPKKDNPEEVIPEVYMVSDQFQQLEMDEVFTESGRRKVLQVRQSLHSTDIIPNFIYEGKSVSEFEPDFFIVNVAHGYSPNSSYNIIKLYDFPVENRSTKTKVLLLC